MWGKIRYRINAKTDHAWSKVKVSIIWIINYDSNWFNILPRSSILQLEKSWTNNTLCPDYADTEIAFVSKVKIACCCKIYTNLNKVLGMLKNQNYY